MEAVLIMFLPIVILYVLFYVVDALFRIGAMAIEFIYKGIRGY